MKRTGTVRASCASNSSPSCAKSDFPSAPGWAIVSWSCCTISRSASPEGLSSASHPCSRGRRSRWRRLSSPGRRPHEAAPSERYYLAVTAPVWLSSYSARWCCYCWPRRCVRGLPSPESFFVLPVVMIVRTMVKNWHREGWPGPSPSPYRTRCWKRWRFACLQGPHALPQTMPLQAGASRGAEQSEAWK